MTPDALRIPAYAKVNLSLEVLGKRSDGYHEVATVMQTVALADEVVVQQSDELTVHCDHQGLHGESNIVWGAARALADHVGIEPRAGITIRKRIPVAAGLGGGSADAAAALRGLNQLWELNLTVEDLRRVARRLGTDVAFQLTGGAALGTGRGDELEPLAGGESVNLLIVVPRDSILRKTPTMYGALAPAITRMGGVREVCSIPTHWLVGTSTAAVAAMRSHGRRWRSFPDFRTYGKRRSRRPVFLPAFPERVRPFSACHRMMRRRPRYEPHWRIPGQACF